MGKGQDGCDAATSMNDLLSGDLARAILESADKNRGDIPEPASRIGARGSQYWENEDGKKHNTDGPAVITVDGTKEWWIDGKRHREGGPAVEHANGDQEWWRDGVLHREQGPAIVVVNDRKEWWRNGSLHREDGPAIEWEDGDKEWWLNGKELSEDEWKAAAGR
jgi:hypothetical protein